MADRNTPQTDIAAWTTDKSPVRRSAGSLTAYHPTVRDRIARWLLGDDPSDFQRGLAVGTVGSAGLGSEQFSLADITPVSTAFGSDKAAHALEDGNYRNAGTAALPDTLQEAESLAMRAEHPSARSQRPFEMDYPNEVAADRFPDTAADDADWTIPATAELRDYLVDRGELALDVKDPNGGRQRPLSTRERVDYILNDSWPAQAVKSAWSGFTMPGDVWAGRADPYDIGRVMDTAGLLSGGVFSTAKSPQVIQKLAKTSERIYDPPVKPTRAFAEDYGTGGVADAAGNLRFDIEGRPLTAKHVVGRVQAGGSDVALPVEAIDEIARAGTGSGIHVMPNGLKSGDSGAIYRNKYTGVPERIEVDGRLTPDKFGRVSRHEIAHIVDDMAKTIPGKGLDDELRLIYNDLNNPQSHGKRFGPEQHPYKKGEVPGELMAEAIRAYMTDPNYIKSVAPKTAARIRHHVNSNPNLNKMIQFNAGGLPVGLMGHDAPMSDDEFMEAWRRGEGA
ncbi:hypothetical protein [Shinella sp. G-2]|uniref:hypothetical protein n=1 Tax=Shinella sp. G-2 TaxID=3133141 RepID=UPI003D049F17